MSALMIVNSVRQGSRCCSENSVLTVSVSVDFHGRLQLLTLMFLHISLTGTGSYVKADDLERRETTIERGILQQFHRSQLGNNRPKKAIVHLKCVTAGAHTTGTVRCTSKGVLRDARSNGNLKKSKYHTCAWPFHYREHLNQSAKTKSML